MASEEINWQAREFIHYEKKTGWFVLITLATAGMMLYFLSQRDFLGIVLFILIYGLILFFSRQKPRTVDVSIGGRGIKYGWTSIPYNEIKNFWIVYDPPEIKTLNIETAAYLNRFLTIQLEDQDPLEIKNFLLEFVPENLDRTENLADKISRKTKF